MSYCRLRTLSPSLLLIFPELFFFLNFPETLSVLVTHCLEIGNVYVSPELAEARQEVTEPSFCVAAWHGFTAAPDR